MAAETYLSQLRSLALEMQNSQDVGDLRIASMLFAALESASPKKNIKEMLDELHPWRSVNSYHRETPQDQSRYWVGRSRDGKTVDFVGRAIYRDNQWVGKCGLIPSLNSFPADSIYWAPLNLFACLDSASRSFAETLIEWPESVEIDSEYP